MTFPDTAGLEHLARAIDEHAAATRTRAGRLLTAAHTARWTSPAATDFRIQAGQVAGGLRAAADRLEGAARTLRGHAHTVRRVEEAIRTAERVAQASADAVEGAAQQGARATSSFIHAIGRRI